jgi:hypothetical protein
MAQSVEFGGHRRQVVFASNLALVRPCLRRCGSRRVGEAYSRPMKSTTRPPVRSLSTVQRRSVMVAVSTSNSALP